MMLAKNMLNDARFVVAYREPNRMVEALDVEREGDLKLFGPFTADEANALLEGNVESGEWDNGAACVMWTDDPADAATAVENGHLNGTFFEYATDHANHYNSIIELLRYADGTHEVMRLPNGSNGAHQWRVPDALADYLPRSLDDLWERYEAEVVNATTTA